MAIGISPTVDFAFKLMLGSPEHVRVTIHFLNAILGDQARITHVEFLNPFLGKECDEDKWAVLDILATYNHGRQLKYRDSDVATLLVDRHPADAALRMATPQHAANTEVRTNTKLGQYPFSGNDPVGYQKTL